MFIARDAKRLVNDEPGDGLYVLSDVKPYRTQLCGWVAKGEMQLCDVEDLAEWEAVHASKLPRLKPGDGPVEVLL